VHSPTGDTTAKWSERGATTCSQHDSDSDSDSDGGCEGATGEKAGAVPRGTPPPLLPATLEPDAWEALVGGALTACADVFLCTPDVTD
jgi:hypothetical protein